jgi:hypothetical protein
MAEAGYPRATRLQIAQHWHANLAHLAANAPNLG